MRHSRKTRSLLQRLDSGTFWTNSASYARFAIVVLHECTLRRAVTIDVALQLSDLYGMLDKAYPPLRSPA